MFAVEFVVETTNVGPTAIISELTLSRPLSYFAFISRPPTKVQCN